VSGSDHRLAVRAAGPGDAQWIADLLIQRWGATVVVSKGRTHEAAALPALVAEIDGDRAGLATWRMEGAEAELVTLDAVVEGRGAGTALLEAVTAAARTAGCRRLWLITSNDNLQALRFYQRRGLRLVAVHRGAIDEARRIKPQIPKVGAAGIAIHDEIELELALGPDGERPPAGDASRAKTTP
jgi:N-acetylglutamate synthase-like GNAT family acetyltransferase